MLFSVFGTPSAIMYGGLNLVRNLAELGLGSHTLANANTTEEFRKVLAGLNLDADAKVVFYSDMPDADLSAMFIKAQAPMIIFMDNFDDVVAYVSASRSMSFADGVRLATRSMCALEPVIHSDTALRFDSKAYHRPLVDLIGEITQFFGAELPAKEKDRISSSLVGEEAARSSVLADYLHRTYPHANAPNKGIERFSSDDRRIIRQLSYYSMMTSGRPSSLVEWPISLFMTTEDPTKPFVGNVALLGPARFFLYGPYLHLPAGEWRAEINFCITENKSGNHLYVDAYAGAVLSVVTTELPAHGSYTFEIGFAITDPLEPVQLRFQILSGAIEGNITFNSIKLRSLDVRPTSIQAVGVPRRDPSPVPREVSH